MTSTAGNDVANVPFTSDQIGSVEDSVKVQLGRSNLGPGQNPPDVGRATFDNNGVLVIPEVTIYGALDDILVAEGWEIQEGVFSHPATWSVTIGNGDVAKELLAMYRARAPFRLLVGGALQLTGYTDGRSASRGEGGGTTITIHGRDNLAVLQDTYVSELKTFTDTTYKDLARFAIQACGLDPDSLIFDDSANRAIKGGIPVSNGPLNTKNPTEEDLLSFAPLTVGSVQLQQQNKLSETWHSFLRRIFDRAGLFFWATADGGFYLGQPDGNAQPSIRLINLGPLKHTPIPGNVTAVSFTDDCTHRHTEAIVYGRHSGGRRLGSAKIKDGSFDDEMRALGYRNQPVVFRDANVTTNAEALFFARRKLAEERRAGWSLEYTIAGHTLSAIGDGARAGDRSVVVPNSVVHVIDDELGFNDNFYIESVRRSRGGDGTRTTLKLMRLTDLIFGGDG